MNLISLFKYRLAVIFLYFLTGIVLTCQITPDILSSINSFEKELVPLKKNKNAESIRKAAPRLYSLAWNIVNAKIPGDLKPYETEIRHLAKILLAQTTILKTKARYATDDVVLGYFNMVVKEHQEMMKKITKFQLKVKAIKKQSRE
jgi:hypothetical protein